MSKMPNARRMNEEWDERAEKNPFYYVSPFRKDWDDKSFYEWGEIQTQTVIDGFLGEQRFELSDKVALEIGCGPGRITRALSSRFKWVYAFDVSERYIQMAREKNRQLKNVTFRVNDGSSFPEIHDDSIDFAFSGFVMIHIKNKEIVKKNISEIARVLKAGGLYRIDPCLKGKFNLKTALYKRAALAPGLAAKIFGRDRLMLTSTMMGAEFQRNEITTIIENNGLSVQIATEEDGSERFYGSMSMKTWFSGKKIKK